MRQRPRGSSIALLVGAAMALGAVLAAPPAVASGPDGKGPYLNFELGANIADAKLVRHNDEGDTGFRFGVAWGYGLTSWFALELETALLLNSVEPEDASSTDWLGQQPLLLNFMFRHEFASGWTPYGGFGMGTIIFHDDELRGADLAWQWTVGLRRDIKENLALGVSYKVDAMFISSLFSNEWVGHDSICASLHWQY